MDYFENVLIRIAFIVLMIVAFVLAGLLVYKITIQPKEEIVIVRQAITSPEKKIIVDDLQYELYEFYTVQRSDNGANYIITYKLKED